MFVSKRKCEKLVNERDYFKSLAERVCETNREIIKFNETLLQRIKELESGKPNMDDMMIRIEDMSTSQKKALLAYLEEEIDGPRGEFE